MIGPDQFLAQAEGLGALMEQMREGRMNHALLISGEAGTGKWTLARGLAAALLCAGDEPRPCGKCKACLQMEEMAHPDLVVLERGKHLTRDDEGKAKNAITIGDVREMIRLTAQHGMEGDRRVVLIRHGEDMRTEAQNALLKTLEEPPEGTFFLMTARRTDALLPTIISRCRPMKMRLWTEAEIEQILRGRGASDDQAFRAAREAEGSLGEAIRLTEDEGYWTFRAEVIRDFMECPSRSDIIRISNKWKDRKDEGEAVFTLLEKIFSRMMRQSFQVSGKTDSGAEFSAQWQSFARRAAPGNYARIFDGIALARKRTVSNVSFQAAVEQLILLFMEAVHTT